MKRARYSNDAISVGALWCGVWCGDRTPPRAMPTKNIAASITAIAHSFRGGVSFSFACPRVPGHVGPFLRPHFLFDRKRSKTAAVSLTAVEGTLGYLIGGALANEFKKIRRRLA